MKNSRFLRMLEVFFQLFLPCKTIEDVVLELQQQEIILNYLNRKIKIAH